jgi:nucleoid-associated protein YgaU
MVVLFLKPYNLFFPAMDATNKTENVYVTELKSLLKDKFFMLLLGISVAIVILSTFYSFIRPKTNSGQVASGAQTSMAEASPTVAAETALVVTPTVSYEDSTGIAGLETVANEEAKPEAKEASTSLFGKIQDKVKAMFDKGTPTPESSEKVAADSEVTQSAEANSPAGLKQGQTYTVVEGDNLWTLAEKVYSSGYNFVDIATSNGITNPDYITVGQKIKMPSVQAKEPTVGDITSPAAMTKAELSVSPTHAVVQGDSLWNIAQKEYNDPYKWTRIAMLNPTITNPDFIMPGQVLKLK